MASYGVDGAARRSPSSCGGYRVEVSRETVRRWLRRADLVYRRPRPVLGPKDPERRARLDALRKVLAGMPAGETAVFQDEVDINTNPKIGSMWMKRGEQAEVETPGNNEKRYLSGSIHWRTGKVFLTEGRPKQGRNTALFLAHLDDLRGRLRCYRKIHVICDRAKCHTSDEVAVYLWDHRDRVELHLLPAYRLESALGHLPAIGESGLRWAKLNRQAELGCGHLVGVRRRIMSLFLDLG